MQNISIGGLWLRKRQMKTVRIAGTPLEPDYHNEIGDDMRDGLKSVGIGQSAAESGWFFEVTAFVPNVFTNEFIGLRISPSSAGRNVFLEVEAQFGLIALPMQVRENFADQVSGDTISPGAEKNGSTGLDGFGLDMSISGLSNEFNRAFVAHSKLNRGSILEADGTCHSLETVDAKASLTVKQACDVRFCDFIHDDLSLTFNDYPEMEYGQVAGSTRLPSELYMKEGNIVFSSSKDEADPHIASGYGSGLTTQSENKAVCRRRLHGDFVAVHAAHVQECAGDAAPVHGSGHPVDLQRGDWPLRERALHRADERGEGPLNGRYHWYGMVNRPVGLDLLFRGGHRG